MTLRHSITTMIMMAAAGVFMTPAVAQSVSSAGGNVVERIENASNGNIEIEIPENILHQIMREDEERRVTTNQPTIRPGINKMQGFRVQVFSDGSNQRSLEARARARGNAIVAKFPKYRGQIYSHSVSPNWYTRVGNFRTQAEASAAMSELKRAFPSFAGEIRVVKSQIVVIGR